MRLTSSVIKSLMIVFSVTLFFPIRSFAVNHEHNMNHQHQSTRFETVRIDGLTLSNFRARASIGSMKNSGAYGEILSNKDDRLIQASSSVAKIVELHQHINDNGVMRMRKVDTGFMIKSNESMVMTPGGYHIMLIGLHKPLKENTSMDLLLKFESGKTIDIAIPIVSIKKLHH